MNALKYEAFVWWGCDRESPVEVIGRNQIYVTVVRYTMSLP